MLTLSNFITLATFINDAWRSKFTEQEVQDNAIEYYNDYQLSLEKGFPTSIMRSLCEGLVEDMDFMDYGDIQTTLDNATMNIVLLQYLNEIVC